jgi:hypothetical protein
MEKPVEITEESYIKEREGAQKLYNTFQSVKCPALGGQSVYFTSEGFNHLVYKSARSERSRKDQIGRFHVLDLAKEIIDISTTYQEYEEKLQEVEVKIKKKRVKETKPIYYWGFIAIIKKKKLRVIVKRVGTVGKYVFWSVIPHWRTTSHGDMHFRDLSEKGLTED